MDDIQRRRASGEVVGRKRKEHSDKGKKRKKQNDQTDHEEDQERSPSPQARRMPTRSGKRAAGRRVSSRAVINSDEDED